MIQQPTSPEKQPQPHNTMECIRYRFICHKKVAFGEAVYIVGNIEQLGEWRIQCAVRLDCYISDFWIADIDIPIDTQIEYKYFVSSYMHHFEMKNLQITEENWIGNEQGMNFCLFLMKREQAQILQARRTKNLKIMSFNLRYENQKDRQEFNWFNRRQNCLELIKQHYPSIIGVQQAKEGQRSYLHQNLSHLYNYIGIPRDLQNDEEVGIFYDRQRFIVIEHGFRWICQSKQPGQIGYGANFPRYFTFMILQDTYVSQKLQNSIKQTTQQVPTWIPQDLLMVINVHLDHESQLARRMGIEQMSQQVQLKSSSYPDRLRDVFIFGDFNTPQKSNIFKRFSQCSPRLQSIREHFLHTSKKDFCDYDYTFNGFLKKPSDVANPLCMIIDHMFIRNSVYKPLEFKVIREMIHQPKNSKYVHVSDHFPIMGIFKPIVKDQF